MKITAVIFLLASLFTLETGKVSAVKLGNQANSKSTSGLIYNLVDSDNDGIPDCIPSCVHDLYLELYDALYRLAQYADCPETIADVTEAQLKIKTITREIYMITKDPVQTAQILQICTQKANLDQC